MDAVLSVEAVVDELFVFVNVVKNEICVILGCCCKNDDFEYLTHVFQKLDAPRSQFKFLFLGNKVDQCLIQV